ncbi:MAG: hypothetical protein C6I00_01590 [Nitratiruptor sp.]|nr:hypothetical protein [Nitratiruptor sp.]NPA83291.1 FxsA family protein [Campylobacterota bacterium]
MIYLLLYLFVEIYVSVKIASAIGPVWTFVEVVVTALYGLWILHNLHIQLGATMRALAHGEIGLEEFEEMNLAMVLGAILLIIPGFLTDIVGLLLQLKVLGKFAAKRIFKMRSSKRREESDVIDVEIIER